VRAGELRTDVERPGGRADEAKYDFAEVERHTFVVNAGHKADVQLRYVVEMVTSAVHCMTTALQLTCAVVRLQISRELVSERTAVRGW
jgi:hypothetical protein